MVTRPTVAHLLGKRFSGYLAIRLPHELDSMVESVVVAYMEAPASERSRTLEAIRPPAAAVLSVFAQRMAAMAVRTDSVVPLYRGVVAVGMADHMLEDPRDNLIVLAAVAHSAGMLGTTLARIVEDVRAYIPEPAYAVVKAFAQQDPRRLLPSMGLAAYGSKENFRYGSGPTTAE